MLRRSMASVSFCSIQLTFYDRLRKIHATGEYCHFEMPLFYRNIANCFLPVYTRLSPRRYYLLGLCIQPFKSAI
jgi:hypothetical protein